MLHVPSRYSPYSNVVQVQDAGSELQQAVCHAVVPMLTHQHRVLCAVSWQTVYNCLEDISSDGTPVCYSAFIADMAV